MARAVPEEPDEGVVPPDPQPDPGSLSGTAWRLMTAPTTLLSLGLITGAYLLAGAFIPGDLSRGVVADRLGFGTAELIFDLGLHAPLSSWIFWLLVLLMVLNLLGRLLIPRSPHPALGARATVAVPLNPDAIPSRVATLTRGARFLRAPDGRSLILTRGAAGQGAVFLTLGVATLLVAFVLQSSQGIDARLSFEPGDLTGVSHRTQVTLAGVTVDRALPYQLVCTPPDPQDRARTLGCLFRGPEQLRAPSEAGGVPVVLRPGDSARVGEVRLSLLFSERVRRRADDGIALLWTHPEASSPRRVEARMGQAVATEPSPSGERLGFTAGEAAGRPWVVKDAEAPELWWPSSRQDDDAPSGHGLSVLASERVTVRLETTPFRWLLWLGHGLAIIGLLLFALVPDLTVTVTPNGSGQSTVSLTTTNRPQQLALWLARLEPPSSEDEA